MANITNNDFNNIETKLSKSEYYDFVISKEKDPHVLYDGSFFYDDNVISYFDMSDGRCISGNTVFSLEEFKWVDSVNDGLLINNIGFTGIDNGYVIFDKDIASNEDIRDVITGSTFEIPSGDTRLRLSLVTGNTGEFVYPSYYMSDLFGWSYVDLYGGFYQGFFKSGEYSVLPDIIKDEMGFEFLIKPDLISEPLDNTLNEKYPNNRGIFFYIGTRSENKFWYEYDRAIIPNLTEKESGGFTLTGNCELYSEYESNNVIDTDNKYILFNRTSNGHTVNTFDENIDYDISVKNVDNPNLFITMNRTSTGYTANSYENIPNVNKQYDLIDDLIGNALCFMVKNDGSIGYRYISFNCDSDSEYVINEEFSNVGVVKDCEYNLILVKLVMNKYSDILTTNRSFKLMFYVGEKLVLTTKSLPELSLKYLSDNSDKQVATAYNISLGGGTQGLCDMIGLNENYKKQYLLPIEENFAGSLIGKLYKFKIRYGRTDYTKIINNYMNHINYIYGLTYIPPTVDLGLVDGVYKRESGYHNVDLYVNAKLNSSSKPLTGFDLYYIVNHDSKVKINENDRLQIPVNGGTVTYEHEVADITVNTLKYYVRVFDTVNNNFGTEKCITINFSDMIFYGPSSVDPNNELINQSDLIRSLPNKVFQDEATSIALNTNPLTGENYNTFVVAMPKSSRIYKVEDKISDGLLNLDITDLFIESTAYVANYNGHMTPYRMYVMKNAIPYNENHTFTVTINTTDMTDYEIPVFEYFRSNRITTVEAGTTVSGNTLFEFKLANIENVKNNSLKIIDTSNATAPIACGPDIVSPITIPIGPMVKTENNATNSWICSAENSMGDTFNSEPFTVTWKYKIFHGSNDEEPIGSEGIRNLNYEVWDDINEPIIINIDKLIYTIAIGSNRRINRVITQNKEDITDNFILRNEKVPVLLADGITYQDYNVYDFDTFIPIELSEGEEFNATITLI